MTNNEEKLRIVIEGVNNAQNTLNGVVGQLGKIDTKATKTGNNIKNAFNTAKLVAVFATLTKVLASGIKKSSDYIENLNLFEVAMGKNIKTAHEFTSAIGENFGMDKSEIVRYMGAFSNLAESMGNTAESAYGVSEALTTIGYDLASLWNISTASAMEKLQAGLVGQTKPLRTLGIDTTYATLQMYALELGIQDQVKTLSQSDKQLLRTIAIMRQASSSWGDMSKTIETPANQLRVFSAQVEKVGRALGNVFIGMFSRILPYVNAFLMVIYELLSALARALGFKLPTYNAENALGGVADEVDNVNDSVEDLNKSLGLMNFDELNNVNTKSGTSDYTAGAYGTVLNDEINSIMDEYNSQLDNVKMKATEIRDTVMEWLGFSSSINKETGETEFKFEGITAGTVIAGLVAIGTALAIISKLFSIGSGIALLFGGGTAIAGATAKVGLLGGAFAKLAGAIGVSVPVLGAIVAGLALVTAGIIALNLTPAIQQIDEFKGATEKTTNALTPLFEGLEEAELKVKQIDFTNAVITDEDVKNIKNRITTVVDALSTGLKNKKQETIDTLNEMFKRGFLSEEEQNKILEQTESAYNEEEKQIQATKDRINRILEDAKNRGTTLKAEEVAELTQLNQSLKEKSVKILSESEQEANTILSRMKQNATALSVDQASEIIKHSAETRDATIKNAQDRYTQEMEAIEALKFDSSPESQALRDKMIADSTATRDETIKNAQDMHNKTYAEFANQNKDIAGYIERDTGKVKSAWSKFWGDVGTLFNKVYTLNILAKITTTGGTGYTGSGLGINTTSIFGAKEGGVIGLASGGVITQPMMYRGVMTGENYRKEAIIPLQRTDIVDQFSSNISANIVSALDKVNEQPIVNQFYVDGIKLTESVNQRTKAFNNMYGKSVS